MGGGGGGGEMDAAMASLLAEFPSLARLDDGRVKCALTGHVMLAKPDVVQPYVKCAPGPGPAIAHHNLRAHNLGGAHFRRRIHGGCCTSTGSHTGIR